VAQKSSIDVRVIARNVLMALLFIFTVYRQTVLRPLWIDSYLLYIPGLTFVPIYLLVIVLCLRLEKRRLLWLLAATILTFAFLCPLRWTLRRQPPEGSIRLVSANIQSWSTDVQETALRLKELEPDILCLQEVWTVDSLDVLRETFPNFEFQGSESLEKSNVLLQGNFVGTKLQVKEMSLKIPHDTAGMVVAGSEANLLVVSLHGSKAHGYIPSEVSKTVKLQTIQAEELLVLRESFEGPCLIAGDFNAPPSGPALKILRGRFRSAFVESGRGLGATFPAAIPLLRIGHVLGTRNITFSNYQTVNIGSDHRVQVVDISL
jgi:endonuclease/exonuclease/phosphatase (EEP) superfamily protein YafD